MPNINDIIKNKKGKKDFFNTYVKSSEIGEKIFKSFKKLYCEGKGFPISETKNKYGIISNLMALSTILELSDMGVNISSFINEFHFLIKYIFDSVYRNGYNAEPIFDASPYLNDSNYQLDSYVETASKVMIVMNDLRIFAVKNDIKKNEFGEAIELSNHTINSYSELINSTEHIIIDTIEFLNSSVLVVKDDKVKKRQIDGNIISRSGLPAEIKYRGWSFCNPSNESELFSTSIYYTYHATNAYVSLYNAYSNILEQIFNNNISDEQDNIESNIFDIQQELYNRNKSFIIKNKDMINDFRIKTASSGRYIETVLDDNGVNIAFDFIKSDFTAISSSSVIEIQENNAVINTLFVLAIFLNAGIDEDYEYVSSNFSFSSKNRDWIYNQLQFSLSNIRKIYRVLKVDKKEEIIDSYKLNVSLLSDKYPNKYNTLVQQFRIGCRDISVYDLIPLLCNTYYIVFDYLIRYPQIEMVENLELIMENCCGNEWLWGDLNGFNINNHLYYVVALENFYSYYNNYELVLSGNNKTYQKEVVRIKEEYETKFTEKNNEQNQLLQKVENLKNELNTKRSNLDKEVEILAQNIFEKKFEQTFINSLENMLNDAAGFCIDAFTKRYTSAQIIDKFKDKRKLKVALALFGSIDFTKIANGKRDFVLMQKDSIEFKRNLEDQINEEIVDNIEVKN